MALVWNYASVCWNWELLAKLETETLTWRSRELEAMASHSMMTSHTPHSSHATSKEGLENAVGIHIMESMTSTILQVLATVIHSSLLLITQNCIGFSNLKEMPSLNIYFPIIMNLYYTSLNFVSWSFFSSSEADE